MGIYAYSWLQFSFPVYLWIVMLTIIISARYSRRIGRGLGQNPVSVLATVLLISYAKLLKAIIVPFSRAKLESISQTDSSTSNTSEIVWLFNGNTPYSDPHHVILVIFAGLVLLFLFLPYTFLLLSGHWLLAKSHWRLLSWINKLKPIMDAYHAPFKRKEYHWIGIFLLVRCVLFLTFAVNAAGNYGLNLLIVTSVTAGISFIKGRVYEKWYNDFLESSFLLNLCILSTATFYVQSEKSLVNDRDKVQSIISSISVGITFVYFLGILVFHACQRIQKLNFLQKVRKSYRLKKQSEELADTDRSLEIISHTSVYVELREPLLDDGRKSQH